MISNQIYFDLITTDYSDPIGLDYSVL